MTLESDKILEKLWLYSMKAKQSVHLRQNNINIDNTVFIELKSLNNVLAVQ